MPQAPATRSDPTPQTYSITELAQLSGLAPHTLRWYEQQGLLGHVPRTTAGRRSYGAEHVGRLEFIAVMQCAGMSLAALNELFAHAIAGRSSLCRRALSEHRRQVRSRITELSSICDRLDMILADESFPLGMAVTSRETSPVGDGNQLAKR